MTYFVHCIAVTVVCSSTGGLGEDMRTASTGLMDLPEAGGPGAGSAPMRIPVVPEVRRPSLPPGRGSLGSGSRFGSAGAHRQLSSHPSHAMPSGAMQTSPCVGCCTISARFQ